MPALLEIVICNSKAKHPIMLIITRQIFGRVCIVFTLALAACLLSFFDLACFSKGKDAKATAREVVHYKPLKKSISIVKDYILFIYFIIIKSIKII